MLQIRHAHSVVKLEETKKRNDPKTSQNGHLLEYAMGSLSLTCIAEKGFSYVELCLFAETFNP